MRYRALIPLVCLVVAAPSLAHANPLQWHAEAGSARAFGGWQGYEYGSGGTGAAAAELPLGRLLGLQLEVGGLWLPHVNAPQDPTLSSNGDSTAFATMAGVRLHPFGDYAGPWIDANGGYVRTGNDDGVGLDAHLGCGLARRRGAPRRRALRRVPAGVRPFRRDATRRCARGLRRHPRRPRPRAPARLHREGGPAAAVASRRAAPVPSDRDGDGIPDATDACPDVVGVVTDDPLTNGCPRLEVRVVDNHIDMCEYV